MNTTRLVQIKEFPMQWWVGDSRVEPFMKNVSIVLDKYNLEKTIRTDIYNRTYEAVYAAIKQYDTKGIK